MNVMNDVSYCWVEGTFTLPKALLRQIDIESRNYSGLLHGQVGPGIEKRILADDDVLTQNYYCEYQKKSLSEMKSRD